MTDTTGRRGFLVRGAAATAGLLGAAHVTAEERASQPEAERELAAEQVDTEPLASLREQYPTTHAGYGGPVGGPTDRGKLVPGLRQPGLPPVELTTNDMVKLPWKLVGGVKEFELRVTPVQRELLPGITMDAYGYNGQLPGPTIEVTQGDRVRIIVHNELPEATTVHWHGLENPVSMDGIPFVTQNLIPAGGRYVYEFTVHQIGTFFYHPHVAMQEAIGMVGLFIIHPKIAYEPTVDRDFALVLQQFSILPNQSIPDTTSMDWNFLTLNGRCGPYATPLVAKLGERVRIRFINFSTLHQHPMHLHGHTFWVTGTGGGRMPETAWIPTNDVIVGVAQVREVEFVANNPGDWVLHCHMFHHMMNHMVSQVGPHIRTAENTAGANVPGFPQIMEGMQMPPEMVKKLTAARETKGMRQGWFMGVAGLFTVFRVLPPELYDRVMLTDDTVPPNSSTPL